MDLSILVVAFCSTIAAIFLLDKISHHIDLQDQPGGRKKHLATTSVVGGIGLAVGILTIAFTEVAIFIDNKFFLAGLVVLMCIGALDDIRHMFPVVRLLAQVGVTCALFYFANIQFLSLGDIFGIGDVGLGPLALVFSCIAVVGGINAVNMMDGLDGLCGGLMVVTFGAIAILANSAGHVTVFTLTATSLVAVGGFLLFNYRFPWNAHARVFMGDAGTYTLGFLLAVFFIMSTQGPEGFMAPITALWLAAVPLADIFRVIMVRARSGKMPLAAGREHVHYLMVDSGFSVRFTVNALLLIAALAAGLGISMELAGMPEALSFLLFVGFCCGFWAASVNMSAITAWIRESTLPIRLGARVRE